MSRGSYRARRTPRRRRPAPPLSHAEREGRRRLREALRWLRNAIDTGRLPLLPDRYCAIVRALRAAAVSEVLQRDALGLPRPRYVDYCGIRFEARCTNWGRLFLVDPNTGVRIVSAYGVL